MFHHQFGLMQHVLRARGDGAKNEFRDACCTKVVNQGHHLLEAPYRCIALSGFAQPFLKSLIITFDDWFVWIPETETEAGAKVIVVDFAA